MSVNFLLLNELAIVLIILNMLNSFGKDQICYRPVFLETTYTDRRPDFCVNMTFSSQGTVSTISIVEREIAIPVSCVALLQIDDDVRVTTLFNISTKLCDLMNFVKKVPMFNTIAQTLTKQHNYSFDCPMKVGTYTMDSMRVGNWKNLLSFVYRPKRVIKLQGGLFEQLSNNSLVPLTTYMISVKIIKKSCGRRD